MKPADDPQVDYKDLVRRGYDRCASEYAANRRQDDSDLLAPLLSRLPDGSAVLDLGCGAGIPIALALAERHRVIGVDISIEMLRLARAAVTGGRFFCAALSQLGGTRTRSGVMVRIFICCTSL